MAPWSLGEATEQLNIMAAATVRARMVQLPKIASLVWEFPSNLPASSWIPVQDPSTSLRRTGGLMGPPLGQIYLARNA